MFCTLKEIFLTMAWWMSEQCRCLTIKNVADDATDLHARLWPCPSVHQCQRRGGINIFLQFSIFKNENKNIIILLRSGQPEQLQGSEERSDMPRSTRTRTRRWVSRRSSGEMKIFWRWQRKRTKWTKWTKQKLVRSPRRPVVPVLHAGRVCQRAAALEEDQRQGAGRHDWPWIASFS